MEGVFTAMNHIDVQRERLRRGWSARDAALHSEQTVTNTTWSRYENNGHLTAKMRKAVQVAFGWSPDWPEMEPPTPNVLTRLAELEGLVHEVLEVQKTAIPGGSEILRDLQQRVSRLERRAGRQGDASG